MHVLSGAYSSTQGFLFVCGCIKDGVKYAATVQKNIDIVVRYFLDYHVIIYADVASAAVWKQYPKTRVLIEQFSPFVTRIQRLSLMRNSLLNAVAIEAERLRFDRQLIYMAMMDLDDVNEKPFHPDVLERVLNRRDEWDVVTFNRYPYYDLWAYRSNRIDLNVWKAVHVIPTVIDFLRFDVETQLNSSVSDFYPVISAFNGFALYKITAIAGCEYNYRTPDGPRQRNPSSIIPESLEIKILASKNEQDCEHVAFHRCLVLKNRAIVTIYREALTGPQIRNGTVKLVRLRDSDFVKKAVVKTDMRYSKKSSININMKPDRFLFVCGCVKNGTKYAAAVQKNINIIASYFTDYQLIVYADVASSIVWKRYPKTRVMVEQFSPFTGSRIKRLSLMRNRLLREISIEIERLRFDRQLIYMAMMDLDDVNEKPFHPDVLERVLNRRDEWDVVTFNRYPYYDLWAYRSNRIDLNVWKAAKFDPSFIDFMRHDVETQLNSSVSDFYPVISAFNGFALYKITAIAGCYYSESRRENMVRNSSLSIIHEHLEMKIRTASSQGREQDCEHVAFHKCMIVKNKARITVYREPLTGAAIFRE